MKVYKDDEGTLLHVDCGSDISAATTRKINLMLPDGSVVVRDATASGTNHLDYTLVLADTALVGQITGNAYVETATGKWTGETFEITVYDNFE